MCEVIYDRSLIVRAGLMPYQTARYEALGQELTMLEGYATGLMAQLFDELDREVMRKFYPLVIQFDCIRSQFNEMPSSTPPLLYLIGTVLTTQ